MDTFLIIVGGLLAVLCVVGLVGVGGMVLVRVMLSEVSKANSRQAEIIVKSVGEIGKVVRDTAIEATQQVVGGILGEAVGRVGEPVMQGTVPEEADLNNPKWLWPEDDEDVLSPGAGDSVWFERVVQGSEDRTVGIEDGEQIIPGVPLPDMTGENYRG